MADEVPVEDGIYDGITDVTYHGDHHSLSSSGARAILDTTPARFRWNQLNGRPPTKAFDLGHAVHSLALGAGPGIIVPTDAKTGLPYKRWQAADAVAQVEQARADGLVPLKLEEAEQAEAMANALRSHPIAGRLLADGKPEQSIWWTDILTGVRLRARPDWLTTVGVDLALVDVKTCDDASPNAVRKSVLNYGYHMQDPFYRDGIATLGMGQADFIFAFVEKPPPHLVAVYRISDDDLALGHQRNRRAIETYAKCLADDDWPGYSDGIEEIVLPPWAPA